MKNKGIKTAALRAISGRTEEWALQLRKELEKEEDEEGEQGEQMLPFPTDKAEFERQMEEYLART